LLEKNKQKQAIKFWVFQKQSLFLRSLLQKYEDKEAKAIMK